MADGAVIWSIISSVFSRAPRYSFGAIYAKRALPWIQEHRQRKGYIGAHGLPVIPGAWSQIVHKVGLTESDLTCTELYFVRVYHLTPKPFAEILLLAFMILQIQI